MKTALVILLSLATCTAALADITLVRDGQPQVFIVVPEGLYKHVQKPAEQLTSDGVGVPGRALAFSSEVGARWPMPSATMQLPVVPGKAYTITINLVVPRQSLAADAGLYLDGKQIARLTKADTLTATLPTTTKDELRLELRSQSWVPMKIDPNSKDPRTLGVQMSRVEMRAADAAEKVFDANVGEWVSKPATA